MADNVEFFDETPPLAIESPEEPKSPLIKMLTKSLSFGKSDAKIGALITKSNTLSTSMAPKLLTSSTSLVLSPRNLSAPPKKVQTKME